MNLKNLLRPGDFVIPLPIHVPAIVQYNSSGMIEKIFIGRENEKQDCTDKLLQYFIGYKMIPNRINVTGGTTWVTGFLYTGEVLHIAGMLSDEHEKQLADLFETNPQQFSFFACSISSTSVDIAGPTAVRQSLSNNKFNMPQGWIVPASIDENILSSWTDSEKFTFHKYLISGFGIFRNGAYLYVSHRLSSDIVNDIDKYVDKNGYVKVKLTCDASTIYLDYSEYNHYCIAKATMLFFDSDHQIIYANNDNVTKEHIHQSMIQCPVCGKTYNIPEFGSVICPDIHCNSRLYTELTRFLTVCELPLLDYNTVKTYIKQEVLTCVSDIFELEEYKNLHPQISITNLLRGLVPNTTIMSIEVFEKIARGCNNNLMTFRYYINNPEAIITDMHINDPDVTKFIAWLDDGYNYSNVIAIIDNDCINIRSTFDGAPIFRNMSFVLTGDFIRGTLSDIQAIIKSYSGKVDDELTEFTSIVVVGDSKENIDGTVIRNAKYLHTPVLSENEFFKRFNIDEDIRPEYVGR